MVCARRGRGRCRVRTAAVSVRDYWLTEIRQGRVFITVPERKSMRSPAPRAAHVNGLRRYLLGTVLGVAVTRRISAADTLRKMSVKIEAGNAAATLAELIRQTGLQILFEADAIRGHTTRAVRGEFAAAEALHLMLDGSGLIFEVINERTIAVRPATLPQAPRHEAIVLR
jgi:hypothetical protein